MNKKELIDCFDSVTPVHNQKQKMLNTILNSRKEKVLPVKRAAKRVSLAAAVIGICVLTATTALAINLGWNEKLIEYLNPSEKQVETLGGAVDTPEATLTKNGVTITVKQTLADSFGIYVLYEMTVPEKIELNNDIKWGLEVLDITTGQTDAISCGTISSEILEQTLNKRTVLLHVQKTIPFENGYVKLILKDLEYVSKNAVTGNIEFTPLVEGEWELNWDLNYIDTSKTIEVNEPVSINGSKDTITKIIISPMSVCVFVKGDDILMGVRPVVTFKDGNKIAYDAQSKNKSFIYYLIDEDNMTYANQLYYRFENIIDIDDVDNITIGDKIIPIR